MRRLDISDSRRKERIIWREIMRSRESRYDHRLHGVLFVCKGLSCYESAAVWGRSPRSLEYWVRRFEEHGPVGLMERGRPGRPSGIRGVDFERLRKELQSDPVTCGYPDKRWSGHLLSSHLVRHYRVRLGARQCQRLLRRLAASGDGSGDGQADAGGPRAIK